MEETKKRIIKLGKQIKFILTISIIFIILLGFTFIVLAVLSLFSEKIASGAMKFMDDSQFNPIITGSAFEDSHIRLAAAICSLSCLIPIIISLIVLKTLRDLIKTMINGKTPFTTENAEKLRHAAFLSLLLIIAGNVTDAIIYFLVLRLFSALFQYGAYLQTKADQTSRIQEEMIVSFAEITENKSSQTGNHVKRVSEYSKIIAQQLGLPDEECEKLRLASTMHDIGKLLVSAQILEKPARLTDEEFTEIKKHSGYGGELLENVEGDIMELARRIALDHHERPDGRGYPQGKHGDEISMEGRIVAVADVYDALTSKRSYKEPWTSQAAFDEIVKNTGTQFDERVVEAFRAAFSKIEETRISYADAAKLTFKASVAK